MKQITAKELFEMREQNHHFQLVDVREEHEVKVSTIGGIHIPMDEIIKRRNELRNDIPVVIHCRSGKRSAAVVHTLEKKFGMTNLYSLQGGILAWADEIDPALSKY